jgi:HEAT repeat protein
MTNHRDRRYIPYVVLACVILLAAGVSWQFFFREDATPKLSTEVSAKPPAAAPEPATKPQTGAAKAPAAKTAPDPTLQLPSNFMEKARKAVDDPDESLRTQTARELRYAPSEEGMRLLVKMLSDPSPQVVSAALNSLSIMGKNSPLADQVYDILEAKAKDKGFTERGQALIRAATFGKDDRVLQVIGSYISEPNDDERQSSVRYAAKALTAIARPACIDPLKAILNNTDDPEIRQQAFGALARIDSGQAQTILETYLLESNPQDRLDVVEAMSLAGKPEFNRSLYNAVVQGKLDETGVAAVVRSPAGPELLKDALSRNILDRGATLNLMKIYEKNISTAPSDRATEIASALTPALNSGDPEFELPALRILGMGFGDYDTTAAELQPKFQSPNNNVRREAVKAYLPYANEANYKPLLDLLWDQDEQVRRMALGVANRFFNASDRNILIKAQSHEDKVIREAASEILKGL